MQESVDPKARRVEVVDADVEMPGEKQGHAPLIEKRQKTAEVPHLGIDTASRWDRYKLALGSTRLPGGLYFDISQILSFCVLPLFSGVPCHG